MPAFALALVQSALIARSAMLDVLREPFITAGRAKGLGEPAVVYKHAFKAALIPTITIIGITLVALLIAGFAAFQFAIQALKGQIEKALGPQGMKETAELCVQKAHYAAAELAKVPGIKLKHPGKPFFKEFTIEVNKPAEPLLAKLLRQGYHAGLALGRWYPTLANCITIAVTEKRTKAEIDGLVAAYREALAG